MQFIDSHAHLNSAEFKDDWKNAVTTAKNNGISIIINVAGDLNDSEWGIKQAEQEPVVYATVGIHPEDLRGQAPNAEQVTNNLRRLISQSQKVMAIGEIGLDYTLDPDQAPKHAQLDLIIPQLQLAYQLALPVILHVRDQKGSTNCFYDMISLLKQFTTSNLSVRRPASSLPVSDNAVPQEELEGRSHAGNTALLHGAPEYERPEATPMDSSHSRPLTGVFHCWTGTPDQLQQALELDFYISFSGILTYKSAGHIVDAAQIVPDNRLLIETDSPFLTPEPARSREHPAVNQPKYVILTAEKLADVRQTTIENIARTTSQNAKRLFRLPW